MEQPIPIIATALPRSNCPQQSQSRKRSTDLERISEIDQSDLYVQQFHNAKSNRQTDLKTKSNNFQNRFNAKHSCKSHVDVLYHFLVRFALTVVLLGIQNFVDVAKKNAVFDFKVQKKCPPFMYCDFSSFTCIMNVDINFVRLKVKHI